MNEQDEIRASLPNSIACGNCGVYRTVNVGRYDYGLVEHCENCDDDEYYLWDEPDVP